MEPKQIVMYTDNLSILRLNAQVSRDCGRIMAVNVDVALLSSQGGCHVRFQSCCTQVTTLEVRSDEIGLLLSYLAALLLSSIRSN
jgi:hypothetical protein